MVYDFVVIGATGMQGRIVSKDLLKNNYSVLMCGRDKSQILPYLKQYKKSGFEYLDLSPSDRIKKLETVLKKAGANVLVNCTESYWNLDILKACLNTGVNSVDLGSDHPMTLYQLALDSKLKKKGIVHITGCGSVPGVGSVMLRYADHKFDTIHTIHAGFAWSSNMKKFVVPFSMPTIMKEMTLPAEKFENGKLKVVPALSELQNKKFFKIGDQMIFLAPHPEEDTFNYYYKKRGLKNMKFYSGFPEHSFNMLRTFIDFGFNNQKKIKVNNVEVAPVDVLAQTLKGLGYPKGYKETENLWVEIWGKKDSKPKRILMECIVPTIKGWEDAGCNIDTGMPASIMAQMIKTGLIKDGGSYAPEAIVPPEPFFKELKKRQMKVFENGKLIN